MKAAIIYGPGDVRTDIVEDPVISADEILVKVHACGICGTDIHTYKTGGGSSPGQGIIPGHEFSGEIVDIGSSVIDLKRGERIIGTGLRDCGECHWCRNNAGFCPNPLVPGEGLPGAMAEYVVVPNPMAGKLVFNIPENASWEEAAVIEPMAVSCYAVEEAGLKSGKPAVILGGGTIGLGIVQAAKAAGAGPVIVSEPSRLRRETASRLGADIVIDPAENDPVEIMLASSMAMAGIIFECSGNPAAFAQAIRMIKPFGRIIQVGIYEKELVLDPEQTKLLFQFRNATVRGSGGQRWDKAVDLTRSGKINTAEMITHTFSLEEVKNAFETQLNASDAIKVIIKPVDE
ncbi:MAG: alcohol dehydrogenase catalytic domain-containing protein [Dehalococcoidia bacterium]